MPHNQTDDIIFQAVAFDMDGLMFNTEDLYDEVGDTYCSVMGNALLVN